MTLLALLLVVAAACLHATWNLASKHASEAGTVFIFFFRLWSVILYLPWVAYLLYRQDIPWHPQTVLLLGLSTVLHLAYTVILLKGYRVADLSVVYPVARGTGPLLASIAAVIWLNDPMQPAQAAGIACIVGGILLIATQGNWRIFAHAQSMAGIRWGLLIGVLIATYSLVDAYGIKTLLIAPVLLDWVSSLGGALLLLPSVLANPASARERMRGNWWLAVFVGLVSPLAYILVLYALKLGAHVSQVAPLREMSMVVATLLGAVWLKEQVGVFRWLGCGTILAGVILISIA